MFNHVSTNGRQALHGVWPLRVARENGFVINEITPSADDARIYGNRPREAEVHYKGQLVGTFAISEQRESKENPNRLLRRLSEVPLPKSGLVERRVQINLDPIDLPQ